MKKQEGEDFTILGSGSIVKQFANLGLIDEYQLVRAFKNGIVLLKYRPA